MASSGLKSEQRRSAGHTILNHARGQNHSYWKVGEDCQKNTLTQRITTFSFVIFILCFMLFFVCIYLDCYDRNKFRINRAMKKVRFKLNDHCIDQYKFTEIFAANYYFLIVKIRIHIKGHFWEWTQIKTVYSHSTPDDILYVCISFSNVDYHSCKLVSYTEGMLYNHLFV